MAVEIKFEANQQYQLDAIASVVELFAGQEGVEFVLVLLRALLSAWGIISTPYDPAAELTPAYLDTVLTA